MAYKKVYFRHDLKHTHTNALNTRLKASLTVRNASGSSDMGLPPMYSDYIPNVGNIFEFGSLLELSDFQVSLPTLRNTKPTKLNQNIVGVKLNITGTGTNVTSEEYMVTGGGLATYENKILGNDFWDVVFPVNKQFCTWQPREKIFLDGQVDFLYWLNNRTTISGKLTVKYTSYYSDNTSANVSVMSDDDVALYDYWCIPVKQSLLAISAKKLKKFSVQILEAGNSIAEQWYYMREPWTETPVQLWFKNSFGVWDTITLSGIAEEATTQINAYQYQNRYEVGQVVSSSFQQLKLSTGNMDSAWLYHLNELYMSSEVYVLGKGGFRRLIKLFTAGIWLKSKIDNSQTLEFRFAQEDRYYSKLI